MIEYYRIVEVKLDNTQFMNAHILKKVLLSSLIILVVVAICFGIVYGYMLTAYRDTSDEKVNTYGSWTAVQCFADGNIKVFEEPAPALSLSETEMEFSGFGDVPAISGDVSWISGTAFKVSYRNAAETVQLELNTRGQLKMLFRSSGVSILLNKTEPEAGGE